MAYNGGDESVVLHFSDFMMLGQSLVLLIVYG